MTREIDARVARAMGYKRASVWVDSEAGHYAWHLMDNDMLEWVLQIEYWRPFEVGDPRDIDGRWDSQVPHYSTDISAAWETIEWCVAQLGLEYEFSFRWEPSRSAWWAVFTTHATYTHYAADAPTAPEAICLAFLAAVETPTTSPP